jgi:hypothetical protein
LGETSGERPEAGFSRSSFELKVEFQQSTSIINLMKNLIQSILSVLFPFQELNDRASVFVQQTWLDKMMTSPQVKDYLWTPPYDNH